MTIDEAFTHFPSLTTQRLHLRPVQLADAEALFAIRSDQQVTEPYGREPYQAIEDAHATIQRFQELYERREAIFWVITFKGTDTFIGSCTLFQFDPDFQCAETGYELHRAYWRQGIMAEAMPSILTYGFTDLGLHRIEANVGAGNTPSRNVILKLGFIYEGNVRQRYYFHGQYADQPRFGLLEDEWLK
jgi:ribosomal-protein-alanine N-acetyltransferase